MTNHRQAEPAAKHMLLLLPLLLLQTSVARLTCCAATVLLAPCQAHLVPPWQQLLLPRRDHSWLWQGPGSTHDYWQQRRRRLLLPQHCQRLLLLRRLQPLLDFC